MSMEPSVTGGLVVSHTSVHLNSIFFENILWVVSGFSRRFIIRGSTRRLRRRRKKRNERPGVLRKRQKTA